MEIVLVTVKTKSYDVSGVHEATIAAGVLGAVTYSFGFLWLYFHPTISEAPHWIESTAAPLVTAVLSFATILYLKRKAKIEYSNLENENIGLKARLDDLLEKTVKLEEMNGILEIESARETLLEAERRQKFIDEDGSIDVLEKWMSANGECVADIAIILAKHHINLAISDHTERVVHIGKSQNMAKLARGIAPQREEINNLWREFDEITGALHEQIFVKGNGQSVSDSDIRPEPLIQSFRDAATYCFDTGRWKLTPVFAERAANLALAGGPSLKPIWFAAESSAANYQSLTGNPQEAVNRLDNALRGYWNYIDRYDIRVLDARYFRAEALCNLGRYEEALAEIDDFAAIQLKERGARHISVVKTGILRSNVLGYLGRSDAALTEIGDLLAALPVGGHTKRRMLAATLIGLGRYEEGLAEIDSFAATQIQELGSSHTSVLATRELRAVALTGLGRHDEAKLEVEDSMPSLLGRPGPHHPYELIIRSARIGVDIESGLDVDHTSDLRIIIEGLTTEIGATAQETLLAHYRLARMLFSSGQIDDARVEIMDTINQFNQKTSLNHEVLRSARALLDIIDGKPTDVSLIH
jgi:tetratricopeptide (TPR) repeat protein